jgi:hypothetical protein
VASLFIDVLGGVCSVSLFFATVALGPLFDGGGDFKRGDVGHDG